MAAAVSVFLLVRRHQRFLSSPTEYTIETRQVDPGPSDPKGESFSGRGGGREEVSPRLLLPPPITSNPVVFFVFFTHVKNKPPCFFCWTWNESSPSLPSTLVVDFGTFCINS